MTINSEVYQKMLENQTVLTSSGTDRESFREVSTTCRKLWKSIMRGDIDAVKYILLNSTSTSPQQSQSDQGSEQQSQQQLHSYNSYNSSQICHHNQFRLSSDSNDSTNSLDNQNNKIFQVTTTRSGSSSRYFSFSIRDNSNTIQQEQQMQGTIQNGAENNTLQSSIIHHLHQSNSDLNTNIQYSPLDSPVTSNLLEIPLNKYGWTALHTACYYGHLNIVQFLVEECESDVNSVNSNGWHSLIFAVFGGHLEVIDYLLYDTSVDQDLLDTQGNTALSIAERINDADVIELLREKLYEEEEQTNNYSSYCFSSSENTSSGKFNSSYESLLKCLEEY